MIPSATTISDLTAAVLNSDDVDEVLEFLADRAIAELQADVFLVLLPLDGYTWVCELARGRFSHVLLGTQLSRTPQGAAGHSKLAFAMAQDDPVHLKELSWTDVALSLTGNYLLAGETALDDEMMNAESHPVNITAREDLMTFGIDGGAARGGLLCAVRFGTERGVPPFSKADKLAASAIASLYSFALNGSTGRSAIEDGLRDERNRIARDLHDLAIQELFGVGMQLEALQEQAKGFSEFESDGPVAKALSTSLAGIERSIAEIRSIVQSLRNETSDVTLTQRLRHECGIATAGLGFAPSLQFHAPVHDIDAITGELEEDVVAVVKECLANAARHAHASAVAVAISLFREGVDTVIQVNVSDNGRGIDPTVTRRSGLANIGSRARRHMGWVDAYSLDPGTMISWRATKFEE